MHLVDYVTNSANSASRYLSELPLFYQVSLAVSTLAIAALALYSFFAPPSSRPKPPPLDFPPDRYQIPAPPKPHHLSSKASSTIDPKCSITRATKGLTGALITYDQFQQPTFVFKPIQTEYQCPNPRLQAAHYKECIAYELHPDIVPKTVLCNFPRANLNDHLAYKNSVSVQGSLQAFVPNCVSTEDTLSRPFSPDLDTDRLHKVAILDITLLNRDRNSNNLLLSSSGLPTAIDHGEILSGPSDIVPDSSRSSSDGLFNFDAWMKLKESNVPFSGTTLDYISTLDPERALKIAQKNFPQCLPLIPLENFTRSMLSTRFLQKDADLDLTAFKTGLFIKHEFEDFWRNYKDYCEINQLNPDCLDTVDHFMQHAWANIRLTPQHSP